MRLSDLTEFQIRVLLLTRKYHCGHHDDPGVGAATVAAKIYGGDWSRVTGAQRSAVQRAFGVLSKHGLVTGPIYQEFWKLTKLGFRKAREARDRMSDQTEDAS